MCGIILNLQRAAQIWMSGHLAASALIKRTRPCDRPKSLTAIRFPVKLARPTKSTCAGSWRKDDDRAQISKPPLLALAPQSDHGSAACAETEAFSQYGPPQSFFELSWLALQKARARKVAQRLMTGRKFLSPPPLMARSAIRSRECRLRGN